MLYVLEGPGRFCSHRLFEWFAVTVLINTGMVVLINNPGESGVMRLVMHHFGDYKTVGLVLLCIGFARAIVLVVNGHAAIWGPRLRCLGSAIGAAVWGAVTGVLVKHGIDSHVFYLSLAHYASLSVFELIASGRSATDVGRRVTMER